MHRKKGNDSRVQSHPQDYNLVEMNAFTPLRYRLQLCQSHEAQAARSLTWQGWGRHHRLSAEIGLFGKGDSKTASSVAEVEIGVVAAVAAAVVVKVPEPDSKPRACDQSPRSDLLPGTVRGMRSREEQARCPVADS